MNRFLYRLGFRPEAAPHKYELDVQLQTVLEEIASSEQRPVSEVVSEIVAGGIDRHQLQQHASLCWQALTPRERDVTGLVCLGYTNRQIASRLGFSYETAKAHVENILGKFGLHSRFDLIRMLSGWDWSAWEDQD